MSTFKVWFAGSVLLLLAAQSFAQSTLSCWYNPSGSHTGADSGEGTVGSITRTGSGDYATSYLISAFDGTACPATLPAGATSGTTVYLVKQDFSNCTNTTVVANPSNVGGTVTMLRWPDFTTKLIVKLGNGGGSTTPNTTYHFYQKCVMFLGDITTDGGGQGVAIFNISRVDQGAPLAFDMYPEGAPAGNKYQSVTLTF